MRNDFASTVKTAKTYADFAEIGTSRSVTAMREMLGPGGWRSAPW